MRSRRRQRAAAEPQTACRRAARWLAAGVAGLPTIGGVPAAAQPAEQYDVAAFRVTDYGGEFSVRYNLDEWNYANPGPDTFVTTPTWEEELTLKARGYVYHPALLDWTLAGGPLLVQYAYDSDQGDSSGSETLFNFDGEFDFLQRRPFPFTLYARRDHPEYYTGLSGRFLTESDEYGARGVLRPPLLPVFAFWDVSHFQSQGQGFGTTVDEDTDRASFRVSLPYRKTDNVRLNLDWIDRNSLSGGPGLPIQESQITTYMAQLTGDNKFGDGGHISVNQALNWIDEDTQLVDLTQVQTLTYAGAGQWQHSDQAWSFANYNYYDTDRTDSWSRSHDFQAGGTHSMGNGITVTGQGHYGADEAPGFTRDVTGVLGSARYGRELKFGNLGVSAALGLDRTDQQSSTDTVAVFDESIVLAGTAPVALSRQFVVSGSVVVTNVPKTQTFVEDMDYRLVTVGNTTSIERLITGSIGDGQTVLVSYEVLTGGTVAYDTTFGSFSANLGLFRYVNLFFNSNDSSNDVRSGVATTPLNDVTRTELGGRVDYPLVSGWTVGGEYRLANQDEDISPYMRNSYDVYLQSARYWNTTARFGIHRETVDYDNSIEDVELVRYLVTVTSRLPGGLMLVYNGEASEDTGGTLPWEDQRHSLRLDWAYRLVRFTLRADYTDVTQGGNNRENKRVTAEIRRVF